ncbi:hypothetical protein ACFL0P_03485 [Candidatus Omnitrophota bacterium]
MKKILSITLIMTLALSICVSGIQAGKDKEAKITRKATSEMTGELVSVRPGSYISILYETRSKRDHGKGEEFEMVFLLDENTTFARKTAEALQADDRIKVKYDEHFEATEEGAEEFVKRIATEISYLGPSDKDKLVGKEK